jgi:hypothetical protein
MGGDVCLLLVALVSALQVLVSRTTTLDCKTAAASFAFELEHLAFDTRETVVLVLCYNKKKGEISDLDSLRESEELLRVDSGEI